MNDAAVQLDVQHLMYPVVAVVCVSVRARVRACVHACVRAYDKSKRGKLAGV